MASVTRKARASRATRRDDARKRMLVAVERLLGEGETYTEISVERLAKEAGISRSTFYAYFEDKGDLLRALTEELTEDFLEVARVWWELPPGASQDDFRSALGEVVAAYRTHKLLMAAVVDAASYDPTVQEQFARMMSAFVEAVAAHIRQGQTDGTVDAQLDVDRTAAWLTWMTERGLHQLVADASAAKTEKWSTALADIVWKTLYAERS